jgi:hypothetical protein
MLRRKMRRHPVLASLLALLAAPAPAGEYTLVEVQLLEEHTSGNPPYASPLADFDGDGALDFIAGRNLFLGRGDGTFAPREVFPETIMVTGVGDVDGDGAPDVLGLSPSPWFAEGGLVEPGEEDEGLRMELRLNRGDGQAFELEQSFPHDVNNIFVLDRIFPQGYPALGDVDRDGLADIVVFGTLVTLQDNGLFMDDTVFLSVRRSPSRAEYEDFEHFLAEPETLADAIDILYWPRLADLDGDGFLDVAAAVRDGLLGAVSVILNDGGAAFQPARAYPSLPESFHEPHTEDLSFADVDRDGAPDLVVFHGDHPHFSILRNRGDGSFEEPLVFAARSRRGAFVEDLDSDGGLDAIVVHAAAVELHFRFMEPEPLPLRAVVDRWAHGSEQISMVRLGDLNGDGLTDAIVPGMRCERRAAPCTIAVLEGRLSDPFLRGDVDEDGALSLTDAVKALNYLFLSGVPPACLDAADLDDDGRLAVTDAVYLLNFIFLGGAGPRLPFPEPGVDPTVDAFLCLR